MEYKPKCNNPDVTTLNVTEPFFGFVAKVDFVAKVGFLSLKYIL